MSEYKPLKCSVRKMSAIDHSPIYEIFVSEPIKAGAILRFDPSSGIMELKNNRGAATEN